MTSRDIDILDDATGAVREFLRQKYNHWNEYGKSVMIEIEVRVMSTNPHEFNKCHSLSRGYWNPIEQAQQELSRQNERVPSPQRTA